VIAGDNTTAGRRGYGGEVDEENCRRVAAGEDIWGPQRPMMKNYVPPKILRDWLESIPTVCAANILL
jgi:hypothetical protein